MNNMKTYLKRWNYMRMLRLILGVFIMAQGLIAADRMIVGMGALLSVMSFLNIGCCGVSGCTTRSLKSRKGMDEIRFEEVKPRNK